MLFWFQIDNMSYSLEIKTQVVILRVQYEFSVMVICQLQRRRTANIPKKHAVTSIYQKVLETASMEDRPHKEDLQQ